MTESHDYKKAQRNFLSFGKYLYLDCNVNYTIINICQNSSNCTLELNFIICKLYGNKSFLHLKIIKKYGKTLEMPLGLKVTCDERYLDSGLHQLSLLLWSNREASKAFPKSSAFDTTSKSPASSKCLHKPLLLC